MNEDQFGTRATRPLGVPNRDGGTRRSALVQDRSRNTRRKLVRAALRLWAERGYERGFEETTVEEIAKAAGVTKGTFYFYFSRKDDVLLELGWGTAEALSREAAAGITEDAQRTEDLVMRLVDFLVARIEGVPRLAVRRSIAEFYRGARTTVAAEGPRFSDAFSAVFHHAQMRGELSTGVAPELLARMMEAISLGAVNNWALGRVGALGEEINAQTAIFLAGVFGSSTER